MWVVAAVDKGEELGACMIQLTKNELPNWTLPCL